VVVGIVVVVVIVVVPFLTAGAVVHALARLDIDEKPVAAVFAVVLPVLGCMDGADTNVEPVVETTGIARWFERVLVDEGKTEDG
jgi:hypothetical protein